MAWPAARANDAGRVPVNVAVAVVAAALTIGGLALTVGGFELGFGEADIEAAPVDQSGLDAPEPATPGAGGSTGSVPLEVSPTAIPTTTPLATPTPTSSPSGSVRSSLSAGSAQPTVTGSSTLNSKLAAPAPRPPAPAPAPPAPAPAPPPKLTDSMLIAPDGVVAVFVIAGGAPVFATVRQDYRGSRPLIPVSEAVYEALPDYPADGTRVIAGDKHYVFAGGAPIGVADVANLGSGRAEIAVHPAAINRSGADGVWAHVRKLPVDGTVLRAGPSGAYYLVTGGVPRPTGASSKAVVVDPLAIERRGGAGIWSHLLAG